MVLNNIQRIKTPPPEIFYQEYVLKQCPVILTDLFDATPLRRWDSLESLKKAPLAQLSLEIKPNYIAHLFQTAPTQETRLMRLVDYLDFLEENPASLDVCSEYPTPEPLLHQLPLDSYRYIGDEKDLYSNMFVAESNNFAHLHYDADQRDVLLYQVFGEKRIAIVHPQETYKLNPIHQPHLRRTSGIFLEHYSEAQKTTFFDYTNAFDSIIYPGETVFIPAMAWHYLEYLQTAMSVGYRLGRNQYKRRLAKLFPMPSVDVQAMSLLLNDETEAKQNHEAWLKKLEKVNMSFFGDSFQCQAALERLCFVLRKNAIGLEPVYSIEEWQRRETLFSA